MNSHLLRIPLFRRTRAAAAGVVAALAAAGSVACSSGGDALLELPVLDASSPSVCFGEPLPCSALDVAGCSTIAGCAVDPNPCGGEALACSSLIDQAECAAQQGCGWTGSACVGGATACDQVATSACVTQAGCSLVPVCTGAPTPCSQIADDVCERQFGCTWGVPTGDASTPSTTETAAEAGLVPCATNPLSICAAPQGCCTIAVESTTKTLSSSLCTARESCTGTFVGR